MEVVVNEAKTHLSKLLRTKGTKPGLAAPLGITGHTAEMKVAVSLPDDLHHRADQLAARLHLKRSELYVLALEQFLAGQEDDPVTACLDGLADEFAAGASAGAAAGRALIDAGAWEW